MRCLKNGAEANGEIPGSSIDKTHSSLSTETAAIVFAAAILMVAGSTPLYAQSSVVKGECNVEASASSDLFDTGDLKSCSDGTSVGGALSNFFSRSKAKTVSAVAPTTVAPGSKSVTPTPTPGAHVAISGSIALDATVSIPGGGTVQVSDGLSVNDSVHSDLSTSPTLSGGIGSGGGLAGAGSYGNGSGQASGAGSGNSFYESAQSAANAASSAAGLGGGGGLGAGVGLSGSSD